MASTQAANQTKATITTQIDRKGRLTPIIEALLAKSSWKSIAAITKFSLLPETKSEDTKTEKDRCAWLAAAFFYIPQHRLFPVGFEGGFAS